jgi:hypothetical protein
MNGVLLGPEVPWSKPIQNRAAETRLCKFALRMDSSEFPTLQLGKVHELIGKGHNDVLILICN